jgi:prephenate dehydrogenase
MKKILIIGLGLIGGSLGLALKQADPALQIFGYNIDEKAILAARAMGAIDKKGALDGDVADSDVIILSSPPGTYSSLLEAMRPYLKPGTVVTDTGSTKQGVMHEFHKLLPETVWGIGGHPMAGSEIQGISGADRYLFENAVYVLTPSDSTPETVTANLSALLKKTGAAIKVMRPDRHDDIVACISHTPHIAAASLVNLTNGNDQTLMMAAGGFRDITRIASSDPGLWEDILLSNRDQLVDKLDQLINELEDFRQALAGEDLTLVREKLEQAVKIRSRIPAVRKGLLPDFYDLVCIVPDRPGIIGEIGALLGSNNINIVDIEILRAREGDGGTVRLGVPSQADAARAVQLLGTIKVKAWVR